MNIDLRKYLQNPSNAYIDTGLMVDATTTIDIVFSYSTPNSWSKIFGSRKPTRICLQAKNDNYLFGSAPGLTDQNIGGGSANDVYAVTFDLQHNFISCNGRNTQTNAMSSTSGPVCLFIEGNDTWETVNERKIYRFRMSKNNIPVIDLYPAVDDAGVACMWDAVTEEYFYPQNGSMIASTEQGNDYYTE